LSRRIESGGQMPVYHPVPDVLASLGISRGLFYKLVRTGSGPVLTKLGERTLISQRNLENWLAQREVRSEARAA
jgi:predicted DNA-binding transcriptional regulator AlpA